MAEHGGCNGERGALLAGARVSEGEEVSERDERVVAIMRLSLARVVGPALAYGHQMVGVA